MGNSGRNPRAASAALLAVGPVALDLLIRFMTTIAVFGVVYVAAGLSIHAMAPPLLCPLLRPGRIEQRTGTSRGS